MESVGPDAFVLATLEYCIGFPIVKILGKNAKLKDVVRKPKGALFRASFDQKQVQVRRIVPFGGDLMEVAEEEEKHMSHNLRLQQELHMALIELHDEALELKDEWWALQKQARRERSVSDYGRIGVRVQLQGQEVLSISWFIQRYSDEPGVKYLHKYLRKGKTNKYRYQMSTFRRSARPWEMPLIREFEEKFEVIRREYTVLADLRKAARRYDSVIEALKAKRVELDMWTWE
ncbi:MAG: conjugative transfer protein MobI(A/C) [Xanthomonadales bacterium]|nr:conjugative transfer protein MobI(A/C) [Xanthomonadales bacterium]